MALKGTIRDFGIADIFQLIGQQGKSGVLVLRNDVDEVRVFFKEGSVVRAESASRPGQMLLGSFMVRSEVLSQEKLEVALREQRRSLKRLGDVLIELGYLKPQAIQEFATLQMTETIYRLFEWTNGTYEFEAQESDSALEGMEPLKAENVVMNGIRMIDEWPGIRAKIRSYALLIERAKPLPPVRREPPSSEFDLEGLGFEASKSVDLDDIGGYERLVYGLIAPGRDVQKIIDLARLGEFEACRAIGNLISSGYVRAVAPVSPSPEVVPVPERDRRRRFSRVSEIAGRIVVSALLVVLAGALVTLISPGALGLDPGGELAYEGDAVRSHLAESQIRVIKRALEVYRMETGVYPETLEALVDARMLDARDVRFPFRRRYFYRIDDGRVVLLPPIH